MNSFSALIIILLSILSSSAVSQQKIPLWTNGAPGYENRKNEPEQAKDWWVKNIHNPSVTVFLPSKEKATGTGVVIFPGGGHKELVFNAEGVEAAQFLNDLGIAAFVVKYRLVREENSPYQFDNVKQDAYRSLRLVRNRATEFNIDPNRIGVMGFSAGGEVAGMVAYDKGEGDLKAPDPIDRANGKPNFQILVYPGPFAVPDSIDKSAPPAFMIAANDDACCSEPIIKLLRLYREAGVPIEVHLYAKGNHAFNMGNRSTLKTISSWPQRLSDWLSDNGYLDKSK